MKDFILFVLGVVAGFIFGLAIYWLPLRQLKNELCAVWNLCSKKYNRDTAIKLKVGTRLKAISPNVQDKEVLSDQQEWIIWNDEGVTWHFTINGWQRARVIQVTNPREDGNPLYKVCHLEIAD